MKETDVDVTKIVRCRDCKYWYKRGFDAVFEHDFGDCRCEHWYNDYSYYETDEDDFCSYGERRCNK